ncbi:hypothetical protein SCB49_04360 [unidentified eubacterium SCB49]|nr:hypothetical protein SCB49_04360 [unidentified eubacterium SCB49]
MSRDRSRLTIILKIISQKTAILIFAQSGKQEGISKPFLKSAVLFDQLNTQTIAKVEKTGLPYFHISEAQQKGNTFGERYTNAIEQVYAKGFDNVITIGNDTPNLNTKQLLEAAKTLQNKEIVLGPSCDGGYYLLGLNKSHFNAELFLKLPWQTAKLTKSISKLLTTNKTEMVLLKRLKDIDKIKDVKMFFDSFHKISEAILKVLRAIFSSKIVILDTCYFQYSPFQQKIYFNKGSPLSCL